MAIRVDNVPIQEITLGVISCILIGQMKLQHELTQTGNRSWTSSESKLVVYYV